MTDETTKATGQTEEGTLGEGKEQEHLPRTGANGTWRHDIALQFDYDLDIDRVHRLAEDIKVNGLREPIVLYEGQVLDGVARYLACGIAGVEPRFRHLTEADGDPRVFYIRQNGARLSKRIAPLGEGKAASKSSARHARETVALLANSVGVSRATAERLRYIDNWAPDLQDRIEQGELSVYGAYKLARRRAEGLDHDDEQVRTFTRTYAAWQDFRRLLARWSAEHADLPLTASQVEFLNTYLLPDLWGAVVRSSEARVGQNGDETTLAEGKGEEPQP